VSDISEADDHATSRWRREIEHDPARTLDEVNVPVLMIYGCAYPVVPVERCWKGGRRHSYSKDAWLGLS
jgi:hypothetical protein